MPQHIPFVARTDQPPAAWSVQPEQQHRSTETTDPAPAPATPPAAPTPTPPTPAATGTDGEALRAEGIEALRREREAVARLEAENRALRDADAERQRQSEAEQTRTVRAQLQSEVDARAQEVTTLRAQLVVRDARDVAVAAGVPLDRWSAFSRHVDLTALTPGDDGLVARDALQAAIDAGLEEAPEFRTTGTARGRSATPGSGAGAGAVHDDLDSAVARALAQMRGQQPGTNATQQ